MTVPKLQFFKIESDYDPLSFNKSNKFNKSSWSANLVLQTVRHGGTMVNKTETRFDPHRAFMGDSKQEHNTTNKLCEVLGKKNAS